jgi:hypothetical protein
LNHLAKFCLALVLTLMSVITISPAVKIANATNWCCVVPPPIPTAGTTWTMEFCIVVDMTGWILGYGPGGHDWILMKAVDNTGTTQFIAGYGLYPSSGKGFAASQAIFSDDYAAGRHWDWKVCWQNISSALWNNIASWINGNAPNLGSGNPYTSLYYYLFSLPVLQGPEPATFNCMAFAGYTAYNYGLKPLNTSDMTDVIGVADPKTFGNALAAKGDGGTYANGSVIKNTGTGDPTSSTSYDAGSYELVLDQGISDPAGVSSGFGVPLTSGTLNCEVVDRSISCSSPLSFNLSQTEVVWDFGDGSRGYQSLSASHDYSSNGTYAVTLFAVDDYDVWSYSGTVSIGGGGGGGSVGGVVVPIHKLALLAPFIGLAFLIVAATTVTAVYVRHARHRKESSDRSMRRSSTVSFL